MKVWTVDMIIEGLENADIGEVERLAQKCGEVLAGKHPGIQGCAIAELMSGYLLGHEPDMRDELLAHHLGTVRALIEGGMRTDPRTGKTIQPPKK